MDEKAKANIDTAKGIIQRQTVASFKTNMSGTASVENLAPGQYWIVGSTNIAKSVIVWDCKIEVHGGRNRVHLDATNAVYAK